MSNLAEWQIGLLVFAFYVFANRLQWYTFETRETGQAVKCGLCGMLCSALSFSVMWQFWVERRLGGIVGAVIAVGVADYLAAKRKGATECQ